MKDLCVKLGGLGALLVCIPAMWEIHNGNRFNPTSYFLWSALSLVCTVVLIRAKRGGHMLMAGYIFSDCSVGVYAFLKSGKAEFGGFELFVALLTLTCACLYVWCEIRNNFKPAVITNAIALVIAGIPQAVDSIRRPEELSYAIGWAYIVISSLSFYGEKPNLNGRLIPAISVVYWFIIMGGVIIKRHFLS